MLEQLDTLPAPSTARAEKKVVVLEATVVFQVTAPLPLAGLEMYAPTQPACENRRTVEPISALPLTVIEVADEGEDGLVEVSAGAAGAVESSVNVTLEVEQAVTLPSESVAVAQKLVVKSSRTVTGIVNVPVLPEEATPAMVPEQSEVV